MNVFEIEIWQSVKHNDKFICNIQRTELVHAMSEAKARQKITLKPAQVNNLPDLKIK
jgi:hypothetical protein